MERLSSPDLSEDRRASPVASRAFHIPSFSSHFGVFFCSPVPPKLRHNTPVMIRY